LNRELRARIFLELSKYTGQIVTADFLKNTASHLPHLGIPRIHSLFEGIYKPAGDPYALSIYSRSAEGAESELYPDQLEVRTDGSWWLRYAPKKGSLEAAGNKALATCRRDGVPILVIVKVKHPPNIKGERYRILGAAFISQEDAHSDSFLLIGASLAMSDGLFGPGEDFIRAQFLIRNRLMVPFQMIREDRSNYQINRAIRDRAFRIVLLEEYNYLCTVCGSKFILREGLEEPLVEAEAAHIISIGSKGPDDPRNGLTFCKRHHWAFDQGLFTVTDASTVKVSRKVKIAIKERFDLEEYEGQHLIPPANENSRPHEDALHWHQQKIFLS
jgi:hypothetical protein